MELPKLPEHWQSRAAIGIGLSAIAAYEYFCPKDEYISDEVARIRKHRLGKLAVHGLVWTTAAHLTGVMPEEWDWLHRLGDLKKD